MKKKIGKKLRYFFVHSQRRLNRVSRNTKKMKTHIDKRSDEFTTWLKLHKLAVSVISLIIIIFFVFHYFDWWGTLGVLFIRHALGNAAAASAGSFTAAVAKLGGKKAFLGSTVFMLVKRDAIDKGMKAFVEHSFSRFKNSLFELVALKKKQWKESSTRKKIITTVLAIFPPAIGWFFVTKLLTAVVQKTIYAIFVAILTFIISISSFLGNFFGVIISLLFQVAIFTKFLEFIEQWTWGKKIVEKMDFLVEKVGEFFIVINRYIRMIDIDTRKFFYKKAKESKKLKKIYIWLGLKINIKFRITPIVWMARGAIKFNNYLIAIIDKGLTPIEKTQKNRDRYINTFEKISIKRIDYINSRREKKITLLEKMKRKSKSIKILKKDKKPWRERRVERLEKQKQKRKKESVAERRNNAILKKSIKREILTLPYQNLVKYGKVPGRAK